MLLNHLKEKKGKFLKCKVNPYLTFSREKRKESLDRCFEKLKLKKKIYAPLCFDQFQCHNRFEIKKNT